jgi:hypothetical protein
MNPLQAIALRDRREQRGWDAFNSGLDEARNLQTYAQDKKLTTGKGLFDGFFDDMTWLGGKKKPTFKAFYESKAPVNPIEYEDLPRPTPEDLEDIESMGQFTQDYDSLASDSERASSIPERRRGMESKTQAEHPPELDEATRNSPISLLLGEDRTRELLKHYDIGELARLFNEEIRNEDFENSPASRPGRFYEKLMSAATQGHGPRAAAEADIEGYEPLRDEMEPFQPASEEAGLFSAFREPELGDIHRWAKIKGLRHDQGVIDELTGRRERDRRYELELEKTEQGQRQKAWDTLRQEQQNLDVRRAGVRNSLSGMHQAMAQEQDPQAKQAIKRSIGVLERELDVIGSDMTRVAKLMDDFGAPDYYARRTERGAFSGDGDGTSEPRGEDLETIDDLASLVKIDPDQRYDETFVRKMLRDKGFDYLNEYSSYIAKILNDRRQAMVGREMEKLEARGKTTAAKAADLSYEQALAEANKMKADKELLTATIHGDFPFSARNSAILSMISPMYKADLDQMNVNPSLAGAWEAVTGQKRNNLKAKFGAALEILRKQYPKKTIKGGAGR